MSGLLARRGFRFQDLYLLRRILRDTADAVAAKIASQDPETRLPLQFGIEAKTSAAETPDWDSIISCSATNEVIEAKSGVIGKDDRLAMWQRLRREIIGSGDRQVRPVLVVDPTCESTEKWQALAREAADRLTRSRQQTVPEQPRAVRNVCDLLDEALSQICDAEDEGQLITPTVALKILATFTVESFSFAYLETSVLAGIELLFPNGFSDQLSDAMLGWLGRRATDKAAPRRLFTARELLGEMGVLQQCAAFDFGMLSRWKARWNDLPALFDQRARTRLGKAGESVPMEQSQPAVVTALDNQAANVVVLGPGGGGKTALLGQIGARAEAQGAEVFGCSADTISEDEVSDFFASLRFKRALLNVREPQCQMYVIVDALDEADPTLRTRWAKQLARFGVDSCGSVITSVRDHAWLNDGITRAQLIDWQPVAIQEWSEQLVRDLLKQRWPEADLSPGLLTLIRQPLMLDLFWRTFVEGGEARSVRDALPETRHQLLSAFWTERMLGAPRHQMPNLQQRLQTVLTRAAAAISDFDDHEIDVAALNVLLSESVIIPEGQLNQKYRFRHPLLRDFAMALWCLAASNSALVAQRWSQIKGGLQRHGALRAILDALGDPLFTADHSHLSRTDVITAMLAAHAEAPTHVAQVLGTFAPEAAFDPARWPESLQRHLPSNFASELVTAARLAGSFRWANSVANWPLDAQWIDDSFTDALRDFVGAIRSRSPAESPTSYVLQLGRVVAAKLRQVSEHPRFSPLFEANARWRKMAAMNEVIPLLPDESTMEWVEREMPVASWRTRGFLFDKLIYLAATDPQRTASIYCAAVGLTKQDGFAIIDPSCWSDNLMEHQAIDWALAGKDQHRSLLKEFPEAFLPVAFDLAEALAGKDKHMRIATAADGLADDYPDYSFWREGRDHGPVGRCIRAIKNASEHLADSNPTLFFSCAAPLFRTAQILTLHSVYLDITLTRVSDHRFRAAFIECLQDARLYRHVSLSHWLQTGLTTLWQRLTATERAVILQNIEALASDHDESIQLLRSRFLACLPQAELSPAQQQVAAELLKEGFRPFPHPRERYRLADISPWSEMPYEDERAKGWPEEFDQQQLQILSRASSRLIGANVKPEVVSENLPTATAAAVQLLPTIAAHQAVLNQPVRFWVLDALEDLLEKHRTAGYDGQDVAPPQALVVGCANLALTILETVPHGITDTSQRSDSWHRPETLWCHALALADSALVCVPVKDDPVTQARFERVLSEAFQSGNAGVQVAISWSVRPWHWLHSEQRRALHNKLVWQTPRQASVLVSSLAATQNESDKNRTAIYRMLLERADIDNPQALAEQLGELCGRYSMVVFSDTHRRSSVADLAREVIDNPTRFALLKGRDARVKFLHSFAFGMKEVAQHHCNNLDLVTDFATWSLKIWLHISPIRENRQESEGVVLFATHWLETKEPEDREIGKLRIWWQQLFPLLHAVAEQGNRPDCFTLFFNLRDPKMHHVLQARELLDCVESLLRRLTPDVKAGRSDLDEIDQDAQDYNSWREILRNAAEALESGRAAGLLQNDWQREKSRSLLAIMAAPPFNIETARMGLYQLHTEAV